MNMTKKAGNTNKFHLALWLLVPFGVFFWIYGEIDDSPGGQLLGLIALIYFFYRVGKWIHIKRLLRNDKDKHTS